MDANRQLQADIDYVRDVVTESERRFDPPAIYVLWAAIGLVGFSLVDFRSDLVPWYWLVASPAGMAASAVLGHRYSQQVGQVSRRAGMKAFLHWLAIPLAILLAAVMIPAGLIDGRGLGSVALLLTTVAYYLAGIHFDRRLLPVSGIGAGGYLAILFIDRFAWTLVGVVFAIGLLAFARSVGGSSADRSHAGQG